MTPAGLEQSMSAFAVPRHLRDGIVRYLINGTEPGGFLQAVLKNDLCMAVVRADRESRSGLAELVLWLYSEAPDKCWGSPERYHDWVAHNGQEGVG